MGINCPLPSDMVIWANGEWDDAGGSGVGQNTIIPFGDPTPPATGSFVAVGITFMGGGIYRVNTGGTTTPDPGDPTNTEVHVGRLDFELRTGPTNPPGTTTIVIESDVLWPADGTENSGPGRSVTAITWPLSLPANTFVAFRVGQAAGAIIDRAHMAMHFIG